MHLLLAFIGNTVTFPIDPIQPAWEESNKNETRNVKVGMYVCILLYIKNRNRVLDMYRVKNDDVDDALYSLPSITNP